MSGKLKCNLCGRCIDSGNRCDSHILPKFIWDEFLSTETTHKAWIFGNSEISKTGSGVVDNSILCRSCDNMLGEKIETHFAPIYKELLRPELLHEIKEFENGNKMLYLTLTQEQQVIIKSFVLLYLWRTAITNKYPLRISDRRLKSLKRSFLDDKYLNRYIVACSYISNMESAMMSSISCNTRNSVKVYDIPFTRGFRFHVLSSLDPKNKDRKMIDIARTPEIMPVLYMGDYLDKGMDEYVNRHLMRDIVKKMRDGDKRKYAKMIARDDKNISEQDALKALGLDE